MDRSQRTTLISALLMSLCLVAFIPGSLKFALTWRELYSGAAGLRDQNLLMPLGIYSLGLEITGLLVLWTGYRKTEPWAWFVMVIIDSFFIFPSTMLTLLLDMRTPSFAWSEWVYGIREGYWPSIWMALGIVNFLVMSVALLLPIRAFFPRTTS